MMRRLAFMCLGSALLVAQIGWDVDGRAPRNPVERPLQTSRSEGARAARSVLPPGLAKKQPGGGWMAPGFGLPKRDGRALPPGIAKRKPNHGQCVSRWAHEASERGLAGRAHARFVSSVAEDRTAVGRDCDKRAALSAALKAAAD
jgi:hypothetical protein